MADENAAAHRYICETEKDLELAARIGQSLLERNKLLQNRNEALEDSISGANETVSQLKHELQLKMQLLEMYNSDFRSEASTSAQTPVRELRVDENLEVLHRKVELLEEENEALQSEVGQLRCLAADFEDKEQLLVTDCLQKLAETKKRMQDLSKDSNSKSDLCVQQQAEITHLLGEVVRHQARTKDLFTETEELKSQLSVAEDTQYELTQELMDLQDRYAEVLDMLHEARDEARQMRAKNAELQSVYDSVYDSLQSELEASDSSPQHRNKSLTPAQFHAMQRAKADATESADPPPHTPPSSPTRKRSESEQRVPRLEIEECEREEAMTPTPGRSTVQRSSSSDSVNSTSTLTLPAFGVPGIPGSRDLHSALKRLSLRRRAEQEYRARRLAALSHRKSQRACFQSESARSPEEVIMGGDSGASTARSHQWSTSLSPHVRHVVKPVAGSSLLARWREMATNDLSSSLVTGVPEAQRNVLLRSITPRSASASRVKHSPSPEDALVRHHTPPATTSPPQSAGPHEAAEMTFTKPDATRTRDSNNRERPTHLLFRHGPSSLSTLSENESHTSTLESHPPDHHHSPLHITTPVCCDDPSSQGLASVLTPTSSNSSVLLRSAAAVNSQCFSSPRNSGFGSGTEV